MKLRMNKSRIYVSYLALFLPGIITVMGFLGIMGLTGCMSSAPKKYFQVYLPDTDSRSPKRGYSGSFGHPPAHVAQNAGNRNNNSFNDKIDAVFMVKSVKMDSIYNDYPIVYRTSPFQLNYYPYNFWVKHPDTMLKDAITDYLIRRNVFTKVINEINQGDPGWVMNSMVYVMEEYDNPRSWTAHLKMEFEVKNFKTGELLLLHPFDRYLKMRKKDIKYLPGAISQILKEEVDRMIDSLKKIGVKVQ